MRGLAWLKKQSSRNLHVPTVARRLNSMGRPYEWAYDEGSGFANSVERPELDPHREKVETVCCAVFSVPKECVGGGGRKAERVTRKRRGKSLQGRRGLSSLATTAARPGGRGVTCSSRSVKRHSVTVLGASDGHLGVKY